MIMGSVPSSDRLITAAGAVVLRPTDRGPEALIVHRPHHDDWSLPKGKLDKNETPDLTAVREVAEETGVTIRLSRPLPDIRYQVEDRPKVVHWWLGVALEDGTEERAADGEVDEVRWVRLEKARELLTYDDERKLLDHAVSLTPTTPLIVVRHAKALPRKEWEGDDEARPLDGHGLDQTEKLTPRLVARGVGRVVSSPAWRCVATVLELASSLGLTIERQSVLSEPYGEANPQSVRTTCGEWRRQVSQSGTPTVFCGHRPVLPDMLAGFGMEDHFFEPAEMAIAHVDEHGEVLDIERIEAP